MLRPCMCLWITPAGILLSLLISFVCVYFLETGIHYVAQAGLEVTIFLPPCQEGWDHRHELHLASLVVNL